MVNYYVEFGLDEKISDEQIVKVLKSERRKWTNRQSAAPGLDERQDAERKVILVQDAIKTIGDKLERKKYDAQLAKAKKGNKVDTQSNTSTQSKTREIDNYQKSPLLIQAQNCYDNGFTEQTIELCNKAISTGSAEEEIYLLLGKSFGDNGNDNGAISTFQTGSQLFPEDIRFADNIANIYLFSKQNYTEAQRYVRMMLAINPELTSALGKQMIIDLYNGQEVKVNEQITVYLKENEFDDEYRYYASRAFLNYAFSFIKTTDEGADYFDNKVGYDKYVEYSDKAFNIYKENSIKDAAERAKKLNVMKMDWPSVVIGGGLLFYIGIIFSEMFKQINVIGPVLMMVGFAATIFLLIKFVKAKRKPLWKLQSENLTGERKFIDKITHTIWNFYKRFYKTIYSPAGIGAAFALVLAIIGWGAKSND